MDKFIEDVKKSLYEAEVKNRRRLCCFLVLGIIYVVSNAWLIVVDTDISFANKLFLWFVSALIVLCLLVINYSYESIRRSRREFHKRIEQFDEEFLAFCKKIREEKEARIKQHEVSSES